MSMFVGAVFLPERTAAIDFDLSLDQDYSAVDKEEQLASSEGSDR